MKKTLLVIIPFFVFACIFSSCKKDKAKEATTAEKVQYKWSIVSIVDHYHSATDGDDTQTSPGTTDDYINFGSDRNVITHFLGADDTEVYSITSDTQITIGSGSGAEIYTIKTLTASQFVLYTKETDGGDYEEITINLKK